MVKTQQESQGFVKHYYTRVSEEYQNLVNTPHARLHDDQQMVFGMGLGVIGVFTFYLGVQFILTFSLLTVVGLIGLVVGAAAFKQCRMLLTNAM